MDRGNLWTWGLLGIGSLCGCLATILAAGAQKPEGPYPNGWRLAEPVVYENLSIFPVVSRRSVETSGFETLDEALASGDAVVTERGGDILRRSRDAWPVAVPYQSGGQPTGADQPRK